MQKKCLEVLAESFEEEGGRCLYFRHIAAQTHIPENKVRIAVRALARKGLAEYHRGLFREADGMAAGSGYCATKEGMLLVRACSKCKIEKAEDDGLCWNCEGL